MHIVKVLENTSNVKATRPFIRQDYFPLAVSKYITFQPFSKYQSKNYPYWGDVLKIIGKQLNEKGIVVVQLGDKNEEHFEGTYNCVGKTTINQAAYIIQNGIAHIGCDSCMAHIAGCLNRPSVIVYGNNFIDNVIPYWNKGIYHYDAYGKWKPSFSDVDPHGFIKRIKPDDIAEGICKMLGLDFDFQLKTIWTGSQCESKRFDVVPNQVLSPKTFKVNGYVIRMDYYHNENNMINQLQQCPCTIVCNRVIDVDIIPYKNRIAEIAYEITKDYDIDFVNYLHQSGFNYYLFSYLEDEELNKMKINFLDFHPIIKKKNDNTDFLDDEIINDLFFESKRFILSNQKIYLTKSTMDLDKPVSNIHSLQQFHSDYLSESLYRDINYLRFFKKKKIASITPP